jgi:hypothetical protein
MDARPSCRAFFYVVTAAPSLEIPTGMAGLLIQNGMRPT